MGRRTRRKVEQAAFAAFVSACAALAFILFLLVKVVPLQARILASAGADIPSLTRYIILVSSAICHYALVFFLFSLPLFFIWCVVSFLPAKRPYSFLFNVSLTLFLLLGAVFVHLGMRLPLFSLNTLLGERVNALEVVLGRPPFSYGDFKKKVLKEDALEFSIEVMREVYSQGDEITVLYMLKNVSGKPQLISNTIVPGGNIYCWVFSPRALVGGREPAAPDIAPIWIDPPRESLVFLAPGQSLDGELSFSSASYGKGTYEVRMVITMYGTLENNILPLTLESNIITFTLNESR